MTRSRRRRTQSGTPVRALGALLLAVAAGACVPGGERETPRLVVMITVDQLRADLLERYDTLFTGGFRRLLDGGLRHPRAAHDHAATSTAPGHATLATGVVPSRHGIVGNAWYERGPDDGGWERVYNVQDTTERILGVPAREGRSPRNLRRPGLADWIAAADPGSRVVSVANKDRAAILMAGKARGDVYWFSGTDGRFVTSTYYREEYPAWVERFHREVLPEFAADSVWRSGVPDGARALTRRDTAEYEYDGVHTHFPHRFADEGAGASRSDFFRWLAACPPLDRAVAEFAKAAVESDSLGLDDHVDFLAVGFSQTDYVGHRFGPLSREQLDNLLHLDAVLGELLAYLDETVGAGRYVVGLSGDHGVMTAPEYLEEMGEPARRVSGEEIRAVVDAAEAEAAQAPDGADPYRRIARRVEAFEIVADAIPYAELGAGEPADSFIRLYRNSFDPRRVTGPLGPLGLYVRMPPDHLASSATASHGSPYLYDRSVPLILYGPGVEAGVSEDDVRTVDMAPSLARLAGVEPPDGLDGRPLVR